jgi:hypothetical protein
MASIGGRQGSTELDGTGAGLPGSTSGSSELVRGAKRPGGHQPDRGPSPDRPERAAC